MSNEKTEWKFLATTAFLVATIALPTLASLFTPEESQQKVTMVLRPNEQKVRQPASLPSLGSPKKEIVIAGAKQELSNLLSNNLISYDFACSKIKTTDFKVEGSYLQLKGKDCSKNSEMPKLNITNKSNGFTASVFVLNGKEYQTDLIQLKEGENQISIQYMSPSGQIEEHTLKVKAGAI
ncbi:hypothetical protein [Bdellovibrio sp. HCB337]|uniref:hypothetical protein n=1 Tax=Bdellovibrio sp. HCB337 TaxID=3394358 RepID=UPI0039A43DE6